MVKNVYISPQSTQSRDPEDDIAAKKLSNALKNLYQSAEISITRWGGYSGKWLKRLVLITSTEKLDIDQLNGQLRRMCGEYIEWVKFEANNANLRPNCTAKDKLKDMKSEIITINY